SGATYGSRGRLLAHGTVHSLTDGVADWPPTTTPGPATTTAARSVRMGRLGICTTPEVRVGKTYAGSSAPVADEPAASSRAARSSGSVRIASSPLGPTGHSVRGRST